jgi:hypothetical protein
MSVTHSWGICVIGKLTLRTALSKFAEEYSIHSASLDGDEFGIGGASPTINSSYNTREYDLKSLGVSTKGFPI